MDALILKVIFLFVTLPLVNCQVCSETRSILREVPETYRFTYIETYQETDCWFFCDVKTRLAEDVTTRYVQRYENFTINVCCDGYVEDDSQAGDGLYCKPNCSLPCQNGFCSRPDECACSTGFALDPLDSHTCKPLCLQDCNISDCAKTQCPLNDSELSDPVCKEPCVNGICTAPDVCECLPGFSKTSARVCEPSEHCQHGTYLRSDKCLCDPGYESVCGECQPTCSNCKHGVCISPEKCQCESGYTMSSNGKCEPHCSHGCSNGTCVTPEVCRCNPGWYMVVEGGLCTPHCDMHCVNGECIAPNVCECNSGYEVSAIERRCVLIQSKKDCKGQEMCSSNDHQERAKEVTEKAVEDVKNPFVENPLSVKAIERVNIPDIHAAMKPNIDESSTTTGKVEAVGTSYN